VPFTQTAQFREGPCARKSDRRVVALSAEALLQDGSTIDATLVDLSYDGCRIKIGIGILPGTKLKLRIPRLGTLDAHARWYSNGTAGLSFSGEESHEKSQTPRKHERLSITATVSLRRGGRKQYQARVFDLTPEGCKLEFVERPRVDEVLWAKFDGLDSIESTVRWVDGFYGGIEFRTPIYAAVFELLLARLA
jgi:PilZ domain